MKLRAVFLILLLASAFSCAALAEEVAPEKILRTIMEGIERGEPDEQGIRGLEDFISAYPASPVTDEAAFRLASIYIQKKDFKKASGHYKRLLEKFPLSPYKMESLYGLGYCLYRVGDIREAAAPLKSVLENTGSSVALKVKAQGLLSAIEDAARKKSDRPLPLIGAILPMKGEYANFGESTLKGILLAANVFGAEKAEKEKTGFDVMIKDSGESDKETEDAIKELSEEEVMGVVGPLLSATATSAAKAAQKEKLPAIALSRKEGLPEIGNYVFRNFLTAKQQSQAIAEYAMRRLGLKRFAILYPENPYGKELASHFKEAVKKNGGLISGEMSYPPEKKDFGSELKTLFGIKTKEQLIGRRHATEYTTTAHVDALYIPDHYTTVAQIAPYLAYYNIKGVQLLGGNGWNSPELVKLGGEYVEGAVFVDGFFAESKKKGTKEFLERFKKAYGYTPGILEAESYDAAMILFSALKGNPKNRDAVRDSIEKTELPEGATGKVRFTPEGEAVKELFLLQVKKGNITEIQEEPRKR